MTNIDINCDVGEGINNENELMPYIQSCNIACGGHAGDENLMKSVIKLAIQHKVKIGAHPSYPDRENFGRKSMILNDLAFINSIQSQVNTLLEIVENQQAELNHIKPHGALYNDVAKDKKKAILFLKAISPFKNEIKLFVPYGSEIEYEAKKQGFEIVYEAFADRNYNNDLSLVSRSKKEAILTNTTAILNHIKNIKVNGFVITVLGEKAPLKAATFCVHSDTENAAIIVKEISNKMNS